MKLEKQLSDADSKSFALNEAQIITQQQLVTLRKQETEIKELKQQLVDATKQNVLLRYALDGAFIWRGEKRRLCANCVKEVVK